MPSSDAQRDKIAALQAAINDYTPGQSGIGIDMAREEALAPIKAKAMRLIAHRLRSESELRSRLLEFTDDAEAVDEVIAACHRTGLIDDAGFARQWVEQRRRKGKSVTLLRRELSAKGVAAEHIEQALGQISDEEQADSLRAIVEKKVAVLREAPSDRKEYDRILRRVSGAAIRRGFGPGVAIAAAREAIDARIAEL